MCTRGKRLNLFTGILCMLLVVMIAVSKSKSMSLNEYSSDDGIEDEVSVLLYTLCTFTKCRLSTINIMTFHLQCNTSLFV